MKKINFSAPLFSLFFLSCALSSTLEAEVIHGIPCCAIEECCENNFNFNVDFLYWSTNFNLISGIDVDVQATEGTADAIIHVMRPERTWDPGVKLALGWNEDSGWGALARWTYFYNSTASNEAIFDFQINAEGFNTSGGSKFSFKYNAADLELGKVIFFTPELLIRPILGLHAIWTQNHTHLNVIAPPNAGMSITTEGFAVGIDMQTESWGVGPSLGVNTSWGNYKGLSLIGNLFGSLVYGKHGSITDIGVDIETELDLSIHAVDREYWQLMSTVLFQAGIAYSGCFFNTNNEFRIAALWESNLITQASNILIFEKTIGMQGLTLNFGFNF